MKSNNLRQDLGQNLAQNIIFGTNSVGQLAKKPFPTEKVNKNSTLSVGRQEKNISRTRSRRYITLKSAPTEYFEKPFFNLRKVAENDFLQVIPMFFDELDNLKVVFHNTKFLDEIFSTYSKENALLFLEWVKTFSIINKNNRRTLLNGTILSQDEDFLRAFKVIKLQHIKKEHKLKNDKEKIYKLILKYFQYNTFSTKEISDKVIIARETVVKYLWKLRDEKRLKKCKNRGGCLCFKAVKS